MAAARSRHLRIPIALNGLNGGAPGTIAQFDFSSTDFGGPWGGTGERATWLFVAEVAFLYNSTNTQGGEIRAARGTRNNGGSVSIANQYDIAPNPGGGLILFATSTNILQVTITVPGAGIGDPYRIVGELRGHVMTWDGA